MEHADRFLRRFYIEKGMFGSLSLTVFFYRPPLSKELKSERYLSKLIGAVGNFSYLFEFASVWGRGDR